MKTDELEIRPSDMGTSLLFLAGLFSIAVSGFLLMIGADGAANLQETGGHSSYAPAMITHPPGGGCCYYEWGGVQYNYEWGWYNYATGTFQMVSYANGTYSNGNFIFTNYHTAFQRSTGGCGGISSHNNGQYQVFWNLTDSHVQTMTRTGDTVFCANDFIQSNTDNVEVTININAASVINPSVSGFATANGSTVIDWNNIFGLIDAVGGD